MLYDENFEVVQGEEATRREIRSRTCMGRGADQLQHVVANGASELFVQVFGEKGKHARCAFGAAQTPFGSCVEIDLVAEVL